MGKIYEVKTSINDFFDNFKIEKKHKCYTFSITDLRNNKDNTWADWEHKKGVYYFVQNNNVVYVGRALVSLGSRIYDQIMKDYEGSDWKKVVEDPNVIVGIVALEDDDRFWAASLEVLLIDGFNPSFNKRIS